MKSIAVMQPYFLPYLGYFQLVASVDDFVVYDDVNFINKGWINRNRILVNGAPQPFTLPLRSASQNRLIYEIELATDSTFVRKFLKTIEQAYRKAPYRTPTLDLICRIVGNPSGNLASFVTSSILEVVGYLGIQTNIVRTSRIYQNTHLRGAERLIDICLRENASTYVNSIGGELLYGKPEFQARGIELCFLRPLTVSYDQGGFAFVPNLSILDVLMHNSPPTILSWLGRPPNP